jgi:phage portal protein BeeE
MDDMCPHGQFVRPAVDQLTRSGPLERAQTYAALIASGVITPDEARLAEQLPPAGTVDTLPGTGDSRDTERNG